MKAFETLQTSYAERMANKEQDLKETKSELQRHEQENVSVKNQLLEKDSEILELKKRVQSLEGNSEQRFENIQNLLQEKGVKSLLYGSLQQ